MAKKIIPWQDFSDFTQSIKLNDVLFNLRARWNTVHEYWTLDIFDKNGIALLLGQKLVFNTDILARYKDERLPDGSIYCVDVGSESQKLSKIGRNDFGNNVLLIYEV
jgi:hypothetical protein